MATPSEPNTLPPAYIPNEHERVQNPTRHETLPTHKPTSPSALALGPNPPPQNPPPPLLNTPSTVLPTTPPTAPRNTVPPPAATPIQAPVDSRTVRLAAERRRKKCVSRILNTVVVLGGVALVVLGVTVVVDGCVNGW
ncbi:hypothetical protein K505DRAFT_371096 [Melanomma pulvis-pyrius CBS 109.77]|uniref:Uncharacterized protein n=1 Tax=Melanomma pulvis-pyrius CBS 109.77 TaxID=1314802 RepID=A0A6A6XTB8_9PLEO|nr:hypothetical protein K505DRAFT_371096 [Melanomma pulvis-pyrius CBS 109.77]